MLAAAAAAYTAYLVYATHHPRPELLVGKDLPHDKTLHFLAYGALGAVVSAAVAARGGWAIHRIPLTLMLLAAFAAADEVTQPLFGRAAEVLDWVYDNIGLGVGILLVTAGVKACQAWHDHATRGSARHGNSRSHRIAN